MHGRVLARAQAGAGNWEGIGLAAAAQLYATIINELLTHANAHPSDVVAAAWGLAGLIRHQTKCGYARCWHH
jgi:N-acetylglucosamine kinase-like BadF-type ATPase